MLNVRRGWSALLFGVAVLGSVGIFGVSPSSASSPSSNLRVVPPDPLPSVTKGHSYLFSFTSKSEIPNYIWSLTGSLPTGLSFNAKTATISGTIAIKTKTAASFAIKVCARGTGLSFAKTTDFDCAVTHLVVKGVAANPSRTPAASPTPVKPSPKGNSSLLSGYSNIPNENVEMVGFAFTSKGKAEMMIQDFFWSDVMYTVNGALDLGAKTLNDVTSVPASGYKADPYELKVGHVYAIKTRGGKYGIIQIALIEPGARLYFFWRYQPNGSTNFS